MSPISRRGLLRAAGAGALVLPLAGRTATTVSATGAAASRPWVGAGPFGQVYDPSTARRRYLNDHTLIRAGGRWHLFSIVGDGAPPGQAPDSSAEVSLAHASAPDPSGPWTGHPDALTVDPSYFGEEHLWAPHVVESDGVHWMFYAAGGRTGAAINAATSTDLFTWTRLPSGPLFRGNAARDPMVLRIGGEWVMYYTELSADGRHQVCHRRSTDLLTWGEPGTAFTDQATSADGVSVTESPFVVARDGWYHLFIGPRNGYEGTDVLASRDPFRFTLDGYAGHVPGHAVEVVTDGRQWWASAAGWFRHGLYLAPLSWQSTPPPWQSPDNPVAGPDAEGRLKVFALDAADRSVLRRVQLDPDTDSWSEWEVFGGPAGAVPVLGRDADGRLEALTLAPGGDRLAHRWQSAPAGAWAPAGVLGEDFGEPGLVLAAPPSAAADPTGRLHVFAVAEDGRLRTRVQDRPGGGWRPWAAFGDRPVAPLRSGAPML
ncbi:glycosyl hydrolase family 32 [Kitasatospora sp. NPDC088346]|uniref:glycosyl hydrolase family 32 n=1 Tax=Kitasatospora sp. NPDC088346 TaxID=3364073 RepID=UPI003803F2DF